MEFDLSQTIVALSSGVAPARRSVIRISGSQTRSILNRLLSSSLPEMKRASCVPATVYPFANSKGEQRTRDLELEVLCYIWPDSRSFTGEPCAELHLLGSLPLVERLLEQIQSLGARMATRGEFTLRSFLAGKLDLTQAEAVLGVIEADGEQELELALEQLGGNLSQPVRVLRDRLLDLIGHLEAGLDFVEEDIEFISAEDLTQELLLVSQQLQELAKQLTNRGSRSRQPTVLLVGLPNAGKSTLFNRLLGEDRAIVSKQAGTTRDAVSGTLTLGERDVELVDTAGIEELSEDSPRALAQSILQSTLLTADLILFCVDAGRGVPEEWLEQKLAELPPASQVLLVGTKSEEVRYDRAQIHVSMHDDQAIVELRKTIQEKLSESEGVSDAMHRAMLRAHRALESASNDLQRAIENSKLDFGEELVAAEIRFALENLGALIGEVHSEDILGNIFSRFCIGK